MLGEGLEPPKSFRTSGLQPDAIAAMRTQRYLLYGAETGIRTRDMLFITVKSARRYEPEAGFEPAACCLQNSYSTTELLRRARFT